MPHSALLQLANAISILIRSGYTNRNPLKKEYWQKKDPNNSDGKKIRIKPKGPIKPTGQTLMGLSGTGKSYGIETILYRMYPQVINHLAYKDQAFPFRQIGQV